MFEWSCSPYDSANDKYYLPYFGKTSKVIQLMRQPSIPFITIYPINTNEVNCTGLATALEFCYTTDLPLEIRSPRQAFQFFTLTRASETVFGVTRSIQVTATPTSARCDGNSVRRRCCEIMDFSLQDQFSINSSNLAIGFGPNQDSHIMPQTLSSLKYSVSSRIVTMLSVINGVRVVSTSPRSPPLRLAWLHIGKFTVF